MLTVIDHTIPHDREDFFQDVHQPAGEMLSISPGEA